MTTDMDANTWFGSVAPRYGGPVPTPNRDSVAYWDGLAQRELRILRCTVCGHWVHYPLACCPKCHSFSLEARAVSGKGYLYSYTIAHREFVTGLKPPYVVALVELDEQPGLRLLSNLINVAEPEIRLGLRLQATFEQIPSGQWLVYFEPDRHGVEGQI